MTHAVHAVISVIHEKVYDKIQREVSKKKLDSLTSVAAAVVIVPTLAFFLASDWSILAWLTSSKGMTSQRRATTWGHHVGGLRTPAAADATRAGVGDWRTGA